jgi:integrase/recombinase XerD
MTPPLLRFLTATGRCPTGRDRAMPPAVGWRLASIPRFLPEDDIARVIAACDGERRLRDRAIILLLVRLGIVISTRDGAAFGCMARGVAKSCCRSAQPGGQRCADRLYKRALPPFAARALFLTEHAPLRPIDRGTIKCVVRRALERAGVESRYKGAHVLRHLAATSMLWHGVSLAGVSTVLRHRSPAMTVHYAKVDMTLLTTIAQPWPGVRHAD